MEESRKPREEEVPDANTMPEEEQAPFGADKASDEREQMGADAEGSPEALPGVGGYEGRDPKSDMPRIPTVPDTQEDSRSHDAEPSRDRDEPPGY